ncbi:MAG: DNA/RNA non-specific endonuclease [Stigonema ocellatum SAG 48.90 = DSM 106950]|nr:DNA/RNA non-specific endonuclease [Stigonema ocellatum SAG 48.90 = DSM 106950]
MPYLASSAIESGSRQTNISISTSEPSSCVHLTLGNPSNAIASVSSPDNYLMIKPQYALSYNRSKGTPNWVSWELNKSYLGGVDRQNNFRPDNTLPAGWGRVTQACLH